MLNNDKNQILDDPIPKEVNEGTDKDKHEWLYNNIDNIIKR